MAENAHKDLTAKPAAGYLAVGTTGKGEIVIEHPDVHADKDGVGHIVFSPDEAEGLAKILVQKAVHARRELGRNK